MLKKYYIMSLLLLVTGFSFAQIIPDIHFETKVHKFSKVQEGEVLKFSYPFSNHGDAPLIINDFKVSCSCTEVQFPKNIIPPNQIDTIQVTFNTRGKIGYQQRTIKLLTNAGDVELMFKGVVKASEATKKAYKKR